MKRSHLSRSAVVVGAVAALAVAGCSSGGTKSSSSPSSGALTASAPGITPTTITIGSHQPLTGVAAPGYDEIAPASTAYFDYVNAHGGIYGRKIAYKYLNDQYNPTDTVSVVKQLVLQDNVYAIFDGLGTPTHLAVTSFLNSEKVPDVVKPASRLRAGVKAAVGGTACTWPRTPEALGRWPPRFTRAGAGTRLCGRASRRAGRARPR